MRRAGEVLRLPRGAPSKVQNHTSTYRIHDGSREGTRAYLIDTGCAWLRTDNGRKGQGKRAESTRFRQTQVDLRSSLGPTTQGSGHGGVEQGVSSSSGQSQSRAATCGVAGDGGIWRSMAAAKRAPYLHPDPLLEALTHGTGCGRPSLADGCRSTLRGQLSERAEGGEPDQTAGTDGLENGWPAQAASPATTDRRVGTALCPVREHHTGSPKHRQHSAAIGRLGASNMALLGRSEGRAKVWRRGWGFCCGKKPDLPGLGCNAAHTTAGRRGSKRARSRGEEPRCCCCCCYYHCCCHCNDGDMEDKPNLCLVERLRTIPGGPGGSGDADR